MFIGPAVMRSSVREVGTSPKMLEPLSLLRKDVDNRTDLTKEKTYV
jgi:hypothetical protein